MTLPVYFEVKIVSVFDPDAWYTDMIGQTIKVREPYPSSWGFENKAGQSVFRNDVEKV